MRGREYICCVGLKRGAVVITWQQMGALDESVRGYTGSVKGVGMVRREGGGIGYVLCSGRVLFASAYWGARVADVFLFYIIVFEVRL